MNKRLLKIIDYKARGRQNVFAEMMGWSPQYVAKLVRGDNFGLTPVLAILSTFKDINARWFLFGEGQMFETEKRVELQQQALSVVQSLLDFEKYLPVMSGEQVREYEEAYKSGCAPVYTPDTRRELDMRLTQRTEELNAKFSAATAKSDELCNHKIVKK